MGAALPVVGAATGVVSTLSGLSAQQKQAQAQRDAIDQQKSTVEANTQLRLLELQRQKLYSEYNHQIDEARRMQVMMQDDAELQLARQQDQAAANIGLLQNQSSFNLGMLQNQQMQQLAEMQRRNQLQIGQQQLGNQLTIGSSQVDLEHQFGKVQLDQALQQGLFQAGVREQQGLLDTLGLDRQAADTLYQSGQQARNLESQASRQATQVLEAIVQRLLGQRQQGEQRDRARQQVLAQLGVSGGGYSASDLALASGDLEQQISEFANLIASGNFNADLLSQQLGLTKEEADALREFGTSMSANLSQQAQSARGLVGAEADYNRLLTSNQYAQQMGGLDFNRQMGNIALTDAYRLQMLNLQDENALAQIQDNQQYLLNQIGLLSGYQNNALDIQSTRALNEIGMGTYKSARDIQYGIERASAELNKQFYDTALSSAGAAVRTQAASELASLRAARNSIQSPGLLSYLGAGLQGYEAISGAIGMMNRGRQQQAPQQPVANQGYGVMPTPSQAFLGSGNYGFLSGVQLGGGFSQTPAHGGFGMVNSGGHIVNQSNHPLYGILARNQYNRALATQTTMPPPQDRLFYQQIRR